jgi:hypothetical protein
LFWRGTLDSNPQNGESVAFVACRHMIAVGDLVRPEPPLSIVCSTSAGCRATNLLLCSLYGPLRTHSPGLLV